MGNSSPEGCSKETRREQTGCVRNGERPDYPSHTKLIFIGVRSGTNVVSYCWTNSRLHQEFLAFSVGTRLCKRWLCCQLLSNHISEEAIELIVADLFQCHGPYSLPRWQHYHHYIYLNTLAAPPQLYCCASYTSSVSLIGITSLILPKDYYPRKKRVSSLFVVWLWELYNTPRSWQIECYIPSPTHSGAGQNKAIVWHSLQVTFLTAESTRPIRHWLQSNENHYMLCIYWCPVTCGTF